MRFASFPQFALSSLLAGVLALSLAGCGSSSSNNLTLTQGNWSVTATSSGAAGTSYIGGSLTQTGSSLAGTMYATGSCIDPSLAINFTGTVKGNNVTLTSTGNTEVITVTATGTPGASGTTVSSLTGSYTVTGGCAGSDAGTVAATVVPSITGTWSGTIVDGNDENVTVSMVLTEATTASTNGTFALTGNLTYTGSTCSITGTLPTGSAWIAGISIVMQGDTVESDDSAGTFTFYPVLNNAASPTSMQGTYQQTYGVCTDDGYLATFTKQQ